MRNIILRQCTCQKCGKVFESRQNNSKQVPKLCHECKLSHPCKICGKLTSYYNIYCSTKCAQADTANERIKYGHIVQGLMVSGEHNRMANPILREKARQGVIKSYTSSLRKERARQMAIRRHLKRGKHLDGKGNLLRSLLELQVASQLQKSGIDYEYEKALWIGEKLYLPDFTLPMGTILEVAGYTINQHQVSSYNDKFKHILEKTQFPLVIITYPEVAPAFDNLKKIRYCDIVKLSIKEPKIATIRLENVDVIDYAHALPFHSGRCSRAHAHSSQIISVEITGYIDNNSMVVDFGDVKKVVKEVSSEFDHKFVIGKNYYKDGMIQWETLSGNHQLILPDSEIMVMDEEATIECMTSRFVQELAKRLPSNIIEIMVEMSEGIDKSAISQFTKSVHLNTINDLDWICEFWENHELKFNPIAELELENGDKNHIDIRKIWNDIHSIETLETLCKDLFTLMIIDYPTLSNVKVWESDKSYAQYWEDPEEAF